MLSVDEVFNAILMARQRVYRVGQPTPLQQLALRDVDATVFAKREDLGPIKAYKWRGAFNAMAALTDAQLAGGVVAASAGNHAQGVALAASVLQVKAVIFMPRSTPEVKKNEVKRHGQDWVEIVLYGDTYDEAASHAKEYAQRHAMYFVHPYNDLQVMGGQGTLADEIVMSGKGPFNRIYLPIGGGGLAAAVACWVKRFWPECQVFGVEGVDQASMSLAIKQGQPTQLDYVDVFCDGTAVRLAGDQTFGLCRDLLDGIVTVSNNEVCHAIRMLWEANRVIPEPSGALALAAFLQDYAAQKVPQDAKSLVVVSGANMDFSQLSEISRRAGITSRQTRFLRIPLHGNRGDIAEFLNSLPEQMSVIDVQYGRLDTPMQYPIFGLAGSSEDFLVLEHDLHERGITMQDVSADDDVRFRIINYDPERFKNPLFVHIEFPERPGAFLDFMLQIRDLAWLCYFNYSYSGERVGRAMVGMEFATPADRIVCLERIRHMQGRTIRAAREMSKAAMDRTMGV